MSSMMGGGVKCFLFCKTVLASTRAEGKTGRNASVSVHVNKYVIF